MKKRGEEATKTNTLKGIRGIKKVRLKKKNTLTTKQLIKLEEVKGEKEGGAEWAGKYFQIFLTTI